MGEFTISASMTLFVWIVSLGVIGINLFIVGGFLVDEGNDAGDGGWWLYAAAGIGATLYLGFILFLMWNDLRKMKRQASLLFITLGGYDVVGPPAGHPRTPDGVHRNGNGHPYQLPSENDESCEPLTPGLGETSLSAPGRDAAPARAESLDGERRENGGGGGENSGSGVGPGKTP